MSPSIVIEKPVKIRLNKRSSNKCTHNLLFLTRFVKISSRISYKYLDDLVGEFRPRRPFSRFFVSRLYSLDDMETGGFKFLLTLACLR